MNKKYLLSSLASLSIVAPVITTIACSDYVPSNAEAEEKRLFKNAKAELENIWNETLINKLYGLDLATKDNDTKYVIAHKLLTNTEIKTILMGIITRKGTTDSNVLVSLAAQLLRTKKEDGEFYTRTEVGSMGFYDMIHPDGTIPLKIGATDDTPPTPLDPYEILIANNLGGLKDGLYRQLISVKYLKLSRTDWTSVFENAEIIKEQIKPLNDIEKDIKDENFFALAKVAFEKRAALKWQIDLSQTKSNEYIGTPALDFTTLQGHVNPGTANSIASKAAYTITKKTRNDGYISESTADQGNGAYAGFNGIISLPSTGTKLLSSDSSNSLSFKIGELQKVKVNTDYIGYINEDGDLVTSTNGGKVKLFPDPTTSKTISINRVNLLIPVWNQTNHEYSWATSLYETKLDELANNIYNLDAQTIYDDAVTYFTQTNKNYDSDKDGTIEETDEKLKTVLDVNIESIKNTLIDEGVKWVLKDDK